MKRKELFAQLFPDEPAFRYGQVLTGLFDPKITRFDEITTLSQGLRDRLQESVAFFSFDNVQVLNSKISLTQKAIVTLRDGRQIETVLMQGKNGRRTICVSSQVGCAMRCGFCATGRMGFTRNLSE